MFKKGDVVNRWHDAGCMGMQMVFGEVIRVNRRTVTVRWERNRVWRIEPQHIELVTGKFAEEIRAEYLSEPSNNRLHLDVGDSPAQQALFTPEADTAEGKLPAPAPRR